LSLSSLFEEQVRDSHAYIASLVDGPAESLAEAVDYVPESVKRDFGAQAYLRLIERGAATLDIPAIASLNGVSAGGWTSYARAMQDAGAVAIELNIYNVPATPTTTGRQVERHRGSTRTATLLATSLRARTSS
jgi:dihydroorotate dehydrogenase (fumarate)